MDACSRPLRAAIAILEAPALAWEIAPVLRMPLELPVTNINRLKRSALVGSMAAYVSSWTFFVVVKDCVRYHFVVNAMKRSMQTWPLNWLGDSLWGWHLAFFSDNQTKGRLVRRRDCHGLVVAWSRLSYAERASMISLGNLLSSHSPATAISKMGE